MPRIKKNDDDDDDDVDVDVDVDVDDDVKDDENESPTKCFVLKKSQKLAYKFDMVKILQQRQDEAEYWKKSAELDIKMKIVDDLIKSEESGSEEVLEIVDLGYVIFNSSKYNSLFKENSDSDTTKLCLQEMQTLSIEEDEIVANTLFSSLLLEDWSPVLDEIKNIFQNWGADLDLLDNSKPLVMRPLNSEECIRPHNFELIINYISHCVRKNNDCFSTNDLLTLAKITFTISFDYHCEKVMSKIVIKNLFNACIERAIHADDETTIIAFAQELFLKWPLDRLLKSIVNFFLPLQGPVATKMYTYLTYKVFNLLLDRTNNIESFPSSIKDWFVHDLVSEDFFKKKPNIVFENFLHLMEHIVIIFDLWDNENLEIIHEFLNPNQKRNDLSRFEQPFYILDQWKMQAFRLHIKEIKAKLQF